jgi:molybdopterin-guanine dinucleotide biosynthesis protein A
MEPQTPLTGALLIGGRSHRMGTPKALLARGDTTLGVYLFQLLESRLREPPLVVGNGALGMAEESFVRLADREPGAGPLSAVLGLFDADPQRDYLVLPSDLYALDIAALDWLIAQRGVGGRVAVRPLLPDRPYGEPLPAIYSAASRPLLEASWSRGERSLAAALGGEHVYEPPLPGNHLRALTNVNRPRDLQALKAAMKNDLPVNSG